MSDDSEESDADVEIDWLDFDPHKNYDFEGSRGPNVFPINTEKVEDFAVIFIGDDLLEFIAT